MNHPDAVTTAWEGDGPSRIRVFDEDAQPAGEIRYDTTEISGPNVVLARNDRYIVGGVVWSPTTGEVNWISVHPDFRRQGIATELWNRAEGAVHSQDLSEDGELWIAGLDQP